ncbi:TlpA disulfide reductase family protein [Achromobacter xylosoxidans]
MNSACCCCLPRSACWPARCWRLRRVRSDTSAAEAASARNTLWNALLWGLLAARLGYLWQYRDAYLPEPLSMLDLRDGGWNGLIGLALAWAYALATILRRRAPWRLTLAALAVASLVWLGGRALIAPPAPQSHPALAELVLSDLQGAPASLAAFRGKPAVVNLWASWCPPCRREMPVFEQAQAGHPDVHFVFLNQGESPRAIADYLRDHAPGLRNVLRDGQSQASRALSNSGLPATLFLDADGRLTGLRVGELSRATLRERLDTLKAANGSEP